MNAQERLLQARIAAGEGRHEEALRELIWFHDHALAEDRSLRGVRLSFALSYWLELADRHPPAGTAYDDLREAKTARLLAGEEDRELFQDVAAMNEAVGDAEATCRLFRRLHEASPAFAAACGSLARGALAEAGQHGLARATLPDPLAAIDAGVAELNDDVADAARRATHLEVVVSAFAGNFTKDLELVARILRHTGDAALAERIEARALAAIVDPEVLRQVEAALRS